MRFPATLLLLALVAAPRPSLARGGRHGTDYKELEAQARLAYERHNPCPATGKIQAWCPGYVIYFTPPAGPALSRKAWPLAWMTPEAAQASRAAWIEERGVAP